jgi:hypothetical protein
MSAHRHHVSQHQQVKLAAHAHCMRVAPSEPERVLWARLRACQLGVRFRRQVVVAGVIVATSPISDAQPNGYLCEAWFSSAPLASKSFGSSTRQI